MRIAVNAWFLDQPGTGSGQYLRNLLRAMPQVAPSYRFLLVAPPGVGEFRVPGLQVELERPHSFWRNRAKRVGKVWFEQVTFPRVCRRWGADVAHVPYWGSPLQPSAPTVVTVHDLIPMLLPAYRGGPLVRLYTSLAAASAQQAAVVLTDSQASKRDIERHLHVPPEWVRCIYLAVGDQFSPEATSDDERIRRLYDLPPRYVLYLAGHDVRKNVAALVESFATVAQADDDATLIIGGKLPERDKPPFYDPRPLVAELGIEDKVRFTGWVEEAHKPAVYRGAACAVFASWYEGFGLPVLEALACGTPLVTSNVSSLPELLGDAGFAVGPDDVPGLAGAILACLVNDDLVAELGRRGPEQAAKFSWLQTAQKTVTVYEEVASCAS
ncbi:MAG: glycosyltransferase family 1 protein [Anaerolineae bacterium]